jgi:gluconolactonase
VYVADNDPQGPRQLLAFDVQPDGTLAGKRVLFDFRTGRGIDGMTLDTEGRIYATAGTGPRAGVYVFDPQGQPLAWIGTPGDPTNCVFGGGEDGSSLYITAALSGQPGTPYGLFRIRLRARGFHRVVLQ